MQTTSLKRFAAPGQRFWLSLLLLACGVIVFPLASNYNDFAPTNDSRIYKIAVPVIFLLAALTMRRRERFQSDGRVAYGFFIASIAIWASWRFGGWLIPYLTAPEGSSLKLFFNKVSEASVVVVAILALVKLGGWDWKFIYLQRGQWLLGLALAHGFSILLVIPFALMTGLRLDMNIVRMQIGGIAAFSLVNAFMEELWLRGVFLRNFIDLLGSRAAILISALTFALFHIGASYFSGALLTQFVITNFALGLMLAYTVWRTDSIWGAVFIHTIADVLLLAGIYGAGGSV